MPLIKKRSQKAFDHNMKAEMEAGKPQKQSIAIAYDMNRRAKKASGGAVQSGSKDMNYAEGGQVSASNEKRPMPSETRNDSKMVQRNSAQKSMPQSGWTDNPTMKQSQGPGMKVSRMRAPKMVPSSVMNAKLHGMEDDLIDAMSPSSPKDQPSSSMNEQGASRQGPSLPMKRKNHELAMMAKGGEVDELGGTAGSPTSRIDTGFGKVIVRREAKGGMINEYISMDEAENDRIEHPVGLESDNDMMRPSMSDYMEDHDAAQYAEGGMAHEMDMQPMDEEKDEHENSIAAAIMERRRMASGGSVESGSPDMNYAEGGQVDLSENADEEPNNEDQMSYEALKKENYSESAGLDQLDSPMDSNEMGDEREDSRSNKHDMIESIRRKMKSRRQMPQE